MRVTKLLFYQIRIGVAHNHVRTTRVLQYFEIPARAGNWCLAIADSFSRCQFAVLVKQSGGGRWQHARAFLADKQKLRAVINAGFKVVANSALLVKMRLSSMRFKRLRRQHRAFLARDRQCLRLPVDV